MALVVGFSFSLVVDLSVGFTAVVPPGEVATVVGATVDGQGVVTTGAAPSAGSLFSAVLSFSLDSLSFSPESLAFSALFVSFSFVSLESLFVLSSSLLSLFSSTFFLSLSSLSLPLFSSSIHKRIYNVKS